MNKVIKIGGAVLSDSNEFVKSFKSLTGAANSPAVVVVSALSKSTRILTKIAFLALEGKPSLANDAINQLFDFYLDFAKEIGLKDSNFDELARSLDCIKKHIVGLLEGISITQELTRRTLDAIISRGEAVTLELVQSYCKHIGLNAECVDSTNLITTDSNFGAAKPILGRSIEQINSILSPILRSGRSAITQGFVAKDASGQITTMGIESSNLTATIIAYALKCNYLEIVTDVDGVRTADPKIVGSTLPVPQLTYRQAFTAANVGLKLIYPAMVTLAEESGISIVFRPTDTAPGQFTTVSKKVASPLPMIIERNNVDLFIADFDSFEDYSRIFSIITKYETKKNRLAFCDFYPDHAAIAIASDGSRKLKAELADFCRHIPDRSIITVLNVLPSKSPDVFGVLAHEEIDFLKYSESTLTTVVESFSARQIINKLHDCLFVG